MSLDRFVSKHGITGVSIWRTEQGTWQGNLRQKDGSFRVRFGDTPEEALEEVMRDYNPVGIVNSATPPQRIEKPKRRRDMDDIL